MKVRLTKVLVVIVVLVLLATSVTGMVFSIVSFNSVKELAEDKEDKDIEVADRDSEEYEENEELDEFEDTENVVIGDVYEIISTEAISDAYISGDDSDLNEEDRKTLEFASDILEEIIDEDMSDFEKEEAIYVWICENISDETGGTVAVPEARGIVDRPYGVLQNKQAVCVGYATTFRLLANMVGLDCMVMHDIELCHSWNIVKLDDGCWYIVDCYYDANESGALYTNFNMNDEMAYFSHNWEGSLYPVANGTEYNYYEMNKVEVADTEELVETIYDLYDSKEGFGVFWLAYDESYNQMEELYYITEGIMGRTYSDFSEVNVWPYESSDGYIIVYNYRDYLEDEGGLDDAIIDYEKLDELLNEYFGDYNYWEDEYWEDEYWEDEYWEDEEYYYEDDVVWEECK